MFRKGRASSSLARATERNGDKTMTTILLILLAVLLLHAVGIYLSRHKEMFAFLFFHNEWRLMRIVERHADEFNKVLFYNNGCLCVGHERMKKIFVIIWVKRDRDLTFSLHTSVTNCLLTDYQAKKSRRVAKKIFINVWKYYLLGEDYLLDKEELEKMEEI